MFRVIIFMARVSLGAVLLDQANVQFMRPCARFFFFPFFLFSLSCARYWNSEWGGGGGTWNCRTPCWETLQGSSWPQQTFWNKSEADFCVYMKLSALTWSQKANKNVKKHKKTLDYTCCSASQLCIMLHSFAPDTNSWSNVHFVSRCMFSVYVTCTSLILAQL